jgi:hypothetical protein
MFTQFFQTEPSSGVVAKAATPLIHQQSTADAIAMRQPPD